jgi:hypothetical protein
MAHPENWLHSLSTTPTDGLLPQDRLAATVSKARIKKNKIKISEKKQGKIGHINMYGKLDSWPGGPACYKLCYAESNF